MKKRHGKPSGASYDGIFVASHLTDEALLRSIDGELSPSHAKDVLRHVQSCWACRSRKQALEDCIADLVTHHNALAAPYLPPSSGGRAILLARLDAATAGIERPAPRMGRLIAAFLDLMRGYRLAHLAAILLLVTGLVVTYFMRTPPVVSAGELLDRTAAYEERSLQGTEEPVIIQQLRVTIGPESIVHTVYHDVARNRDATRDEGINPEQASLQKAYARSSLAWNSPLDIESFRRWRADHLPSRESVSRGGSNQLLLTTTFASGPVREANLTIHIPDYHAVREGFRLQDNSNIQIAELSRVVIPFAQLSRSIFAPDEIAPAPRTLPRATPAAQPHAFFKAVPTAAELSKTVVQAERLLHTLGADLGEQINLSASSNHNVLVTGVVRDTERKQQLSAALHDLPYLRVELSSVDEAKAAATAPEPSPSQPVVSVPMVLTSSPPLLERELSSHFPDRDQRIAYINQTLTICAARLLPPRLGPQTARRSSSRLHDRCSGRCLPRRSKDPPRRPHLSASRRSAHPAEPASSVSPHFIQCADARQQRRARAACGSRRVAGSSSPHPLLNRDGP